MNHDTVFSGPQFFEYFLAYLKNHPNAHVRIITYLIKYSKTGVIHDIFAELNRRPSFVAVGITRYVSLRAIQREIKLWQRAFPNIKIKLVYNDHRKLYIVREQFDNPIRIENRAWTGSANLTEAYTKNCMVEVSKEQMPKVWEEWWGLESEFNLNVNKKTYE